MRDIYFTAAGYQRQKLYVYLFLYMSSAVL